MGDRCTIQERERERERDKERGKASQSLLLKLWHRCEVYKKMQGHNFFFISVKHERAELAPFSAYATIYLTHQHMPTYQTWQSTLRLFYPPARRKLCSSTLLHRSTSNGQFSRRKRAPPCPRCPLSFLTIYSCGPGAIVALLFLLFLQVGVPFKGANKDRHRGGNIHITRYTLREECVRSFS
jgi:hypothetical protein